MRRWRSCWGDEWRARVAIAILKREKAQSWKQRRVCRASSAVKHLRSCPLEERRRTHGNVAVALSFLHGSEPRHALRSTIRGTPQETGNTWLDTQTRERFAPRLLEARRANARYPRPRRQSQAPVRTRGRQSNPGARRGLKSAELGSRLTHRSLRMSGAKQSLLQRSTNSSSRLPKSWDTSVERSRCRLR